MCGKKKLFYEMEFNFLGARVFEIILMTMWAAKLTDANYTNVGGYVNNTF